jgi:hypothetical protein
MLRFESVVAGKQRSTIETSRESPKEGNQVDNNERRDALQRTAVVVKPATIKLR